MKYYCKNCGSTFEPAPHLEAYFQDNTVDYCPICLKQGDDVYTAIPNFETVTQWEARKWRKYPDTAPVYALDEKGSPRIEPFYFLTDLRTVDKDRRIVLIANEAGKPPDNWRPDVTGKEAEE
jgi:hypothetical protein